MWLWITCSFSLVYLHVFPHDKRSTRLDQIFKSVFQRKYAIALTLPPKEGCCPTNIVLIDSLLGCQLQRGYFLQIIDQSTKSSLSPVRVFQICMGKVCQLQGSGNYAIMSPKQTKQSFIFQLNLY